MLPSILLSYLSFAEAPNNERNNLRDKNHFKRGDFFELGCLLENTTYHILKKKMNATMCKIKQK